MKRKNYNKWFTFFNFVLVVVLTCPAVAGPKSQGHVDNHPPYQRKPQAQRLSFDPFHKNDPSSHPRFLLNPQVQHQAGQAYTEETIREVVNHSRPIQTQSDYNHLAIKDNTSKQTVGLMQIYHARHGQVFQETLGKAGKLDANTKAVGFVIDPAHQNKGYATDAVKTVATELFTQEGASRLTATVQPDNTASKRVLEKAGFKQKFSSIPDSEYQGGRSDVYVLSKKRWQKNEATRDGSTATPDKTSPPTYVPAAFDH